jgi:hypothetical protein
MVGGWELQISVPEGFPWYGQQNEGGCCHATKEHSATIFLSAHKKQTTAFCTSLVQIDSSAAMFTVQVQLTYEVKSYLKQSFIMFAHEFQCCQLLAV